MKTYKVKCQFCGTKIDRHHRARTATCYDCKVKKRREVSLVRSRRLRAEEASD